MAVRVGLGALTKVDLQRLWRNDRSMIKLVFEVKPKETLMWHEFKPHHFAKILCTHSYKFIKKQPNAV